MSQVTFKEYGLTEPDVKEILRYAGVRGDGREYTELVSELLRLSEREIRPRACYIRVPVMVSGTHVDLDLFSVVSSSLSRALFGCSEAYIFAATIGVGIDRLMAKFGVSRASSQLILQAIGTERVERLCDLVCKELEEQTAVEGKVCTGRFSPGYGDLPLSAQSDVVRILDTGRKIGVTLGETLLLTPTKSVTAIVGIKEK